MTKHQHVWVWLPHIEWVMTADGQRFKAFNVICSGCDRREWAHGRGPG